MIIHYTITAESEGEKILKIGQHLPKLWLIKYGSFFYETRCTLLQIMVTVSQPSPFVFVVVNGLTLSSASKVGSSNRVKSENEGRLQGISVSVPALIKRDTCSNSNSIWLKLFLCFTFTCGHVGSRKRWPYNIKRITHVWSRWLMPRYISNCAQQWCKAINHRNTNGSKLSPWTLKQLVLFTRFPN